MVESPAGPVKVPLGIRGEEISVGSHVACFWESEREFGEAVDFLREGLRRGDHLVVFGYPEANERVLDVLRGRGEEVDALLEEGRITVLGAADSGDEILGNIAEAFRRAMEGGAELIRLLGNIGWGKEGWPDQEELLRFEARVTDAASAFPCVVVCLYDVGNLGGDVLLHGAFECHPITIYRNLVRENPYHVDIRDFLERRARITTED